MSRACEPTARAAVARFRLDDEQRVVRLGTRQCYSSHPFVRLIVLERRAAALDPNSMNAAASILFDSLNGLCSCAPHQSLHLLASSVRRTCTRHTTELDKQRALVDP